MRGYGCHIYHMNEKDVLVKNDNIYCFAGLQYKKGTIYIDKFKEEETEKYIVRLLKVINEITPCELVKIKNKEYIKFDLLPTYDQSLVLLNFIRNLWHSPSNNNFDSDNDDATHDEEYSVEFFEKLIETKEKDALGKLTEANIKACAKAKIRGSIGHSNCHSHSKLKVKKVEQLKKYKGNSTFAFLSN